MKSPDRSERFTRECFTVHARRFRLNLGPTTKIMGIVNVTPDSFSDDGCLRFSGDPIRRAVALGKKLAREGADIIDIGGESSRPGAKKISVSEEVARVIPVVKQLSRDLKIPVSVDTYKPLVARQALEAGASIVNTIRGVRPEKSLLKAVRDHQAAVVLMHMRGTPATMQKHLTYKTNILTEIIDALRKSIEICLEIGIKSDRIIIDPGIGFGKTLHHNLEIINRLTELRILHQPVLIGTSRKSFIGHVLNEDVGHRLMGTAASVSAGILRGAHMVRVHEVKPIKETVLMTDAIINQQE